jgi:hypothetical protein
MIGDREKVTGKAKQLLDYMLQPDWERRPDTNELLKFINNELGIKTPTKIELSQYEKALVKELNNRFGDENSYREHYRNLQKATLIDQQIDYLQTQIKKRGKPEEMADYQLMDLAWIQHELGNDLF